jgi:hypothetical protein
VAAVGLVLEMKERTMFPSLTLWHFLLPCISICIALHGCMMREEADDTHLNSRLSLYLLKEIVHELMHTNV